MAARYSISSTPGLRKTEREEVDPGQLQPRTHFKRTNRRDQADMGRVWVGSYSLPKPAQTGPKPALSRTCLQQQVSGWPRERGGAAYRTRTCDPRITKALDALRKCFMLH